MANYFGGYSPPQQFFPYQQPTTNNGVMVATVQGEAGARVYPVAAGNTVLLIDFDAKKFWLKSTDNNGMPSRFAAFTFTEEVRQTGDTGNFISRGEFDDLKKTIDAQLKQIVDLIRGGTGNVATATAVDEQPAIIPAAT